jgi:shikimate O-hydroxycinnamoyltransferase
MRSVVIKPGRECQGTTACTFDDWMQRYSTASVAFCFRQRVDIERLRGALEHVLVDFPDYAGRLALDSRKLRIEHGSGALLELASSSESFEALAAAAQGVGRSHVLCPSMPSRRVLAGKAPVLAARLTETADGSVLGVTWHHAIGDLHSTMQLLSAWSKAYENAAYDAPPLVPDREQYLAERLPDPESSVAALRLCSFGEVFSLAAFALRRKRRVDIQFSQDEMAQLQHSAMRDGFVTESDALCAHAFAVLRKLRPERPVMRLVLAVNYRKRVGLPASLLGNMAGMVTLEADASGDAATMASELRRKLVDFATRHLDHHAVRRFLDQHSGRFERLRVIPNVLDASGGTWIVSNCKSFPVYELEFEGVRPARFSLLTDPPLPMMANLFDRPNRGGTTLTMYLPHVLAQRADSPEGRSLMHTHSTDA